jgi:hypothetical protein
MAEHIIYFYESMFSALNSLFLLSDLPSQDSFFSAFLIFLEIMLFLSRFELTISDVEKLQTLLGLSFRLSSLEIFVSSLKVTFS